MAPVTRAYKHFYGITAYVAAQWTELQTDGIFPYKQQQAVAVTHWILDSVQTRVCSHLAQTNNLQLEIAAGIPQHLQQIQL